MRTALILATVAGIGLGLAAGALAAGAFAASLPYSYDGYYRPRYRRVYYGPGPYAYALAITGRATTMTEL